MHPNQKIRNNYMSHVKILSWTGQGFIGRAIRFFSSGKVAHSAMQIDGVVYESIQFVGVQKWDRLDLPKGRVEPCEELLLEVTLEQKILMLKFWESILGKPYDYLSVLRFISRKRETESTKDKYFCSEAVCEACEYAGVPLFERVDASLIPPSWVRRSPKLK